MMMLEDRMNEKSLMLTLLRKLFFLLFFPLELYKSISKVLVKSKLNQANVYHSYHAMQERDAYIALRQYKSKMKRNRGNILDIGCGPGDLTVNYLLPFLSPNGQMVGVDISPAMIQLAKSKYNNDPRLRFEVMDIKTAAVAKKYRETFDTVFSFYCLHWIQEQRMTMKNIHDILRPGGQILLLFLASGPIYTLYEKLANKEKWAPYMKDYKSVISPYHDCADPVKKISNLLSSIGFEVVDCSCKPTMYSMPDCEYLYKSIEAVNPFLANIPQDLLEQYRKDCQKEIHNSRLCTVSENTGNVTFTYSLITVYATKPNSEKDSSSDGLR